MFENGSGNAATFLTDDTLEDFRKVEATSTQYGHRKQKNLGWFGSSLHFFRMLPLSRRIALMFTVFLVMLATSLMLKLVFPLFF